MYLTAMSPLQSTNAEIRRRMRHEERRRELRRRADLPVRAIDSMLAELEELHLAGRKRVPDTLDDRLERLSDAIPADCRRELRSRITIVHLMDRLYSIQDCLLSRRVARGRVELVAEDDVLPQAS
jgi:hypothetical protein